MEDVWLFLSYTATKLKQVSLLEKKAGKEVHINQKRKDLFIYKQYSKHVFEWG